MKRSTNRILTTHAGRLQGSTDFAGMMRSMQRGELKDTAAFHAAVKREMAEVVRKQAEVGMDVISDGELGKFGGFTYYGQRMTNLAVRPTKPGEPAIMSANTNERMEFKEFYDELRFAPQAPERMVCNGPLSYQGQQEVQNDIALFKEALQGVKSEEQFMCVLAPGWIEHFLWNEYYKSDEEYLFAIAEAMKRRVQGHRRCRLHPAARRSRACPTPTT